MQEYIELVPLADLNGEISFTVHYVKSSFYPRASFQPWTLTLVTLQLQFSSLSFRLLMLLLM